MKFDLVTRGYIELYLNGQFVSRHTVESKAVESALKQPGAYELRFPVKTLTWSVDATEPTPGDWYPRPGEINGDLSLA